MTDVCQMCRLFSKVWLENGIVCQQHSKKLWYEHVKELLLWHGHDMVQQCIAKTIEDVSREWQAVIGAKQGAYRRHGCNYHVKTNTVISTYNSRQEGGHVTSTAVSLRLTAGKVDQNPRKSN